MLNGMCWDCNGGGRPASRRNSLARSPSEHLRFI